MTTEVTPDETYAFFMQAWNTVGNVGGFVHYSIEELPMPELIEQQIHDAHVSFEYLLTFRGVRIYRGAYQKRWMYLHKTTVGCKDAYNIINSTFVDKINRIAQELDVTQ